MQLPKGSWTLGPDPEELVGVGRGRRLAQPMEHVARDASAGVVVKFCLI